MKKNTSSVVASGMLIAIAAGILIGELAVSTSRACFALLLIAAAVCGVVIGLRCTEDNETRGELGGICGAAVFVVYHLILVHKGYEYQHSPYLYFMIGIIGCTAMAAGCAVKAGEVEMGNTSSQHQNSSSTSSRKSAPTTTTNNTTPKPTSSNAEDQAKDIAKQVAEKWKK